MKKFIFIVAFFSSEVASAGCSRFDLYQRVRQFYLPFDDAVYVTRDWFTKSARKDLEMWDDKTFVESQLSYMKDKGGVTSFMITPKKTKNGVLVKIKIAFPEGFVEDDHLWMCEEDYWRMHN